MNPNNDNFRIPLIWQLVCAAILIVSRTLLIFASWNYGIYYLCSLFGYVLPHIGFRACMMIWASLCTFNVFKIHPSEKIDPSDGLKYLNTWISKTVTYILITIFIYFIYICIV